MSSSPSSSQSNSSQLPDFSNVYGFVEKDADLVNPEEPKQYPAGTPSSSQLDSSQSGSIATVAVTSDGEEILSSPHETSQNSLEGESATKEDGIAGVKDGDLNDFFENRLTTGDTRAAKSDQLSQRGSESSDRDFVPSSQPEIDYRYLTKQRSPASEILRSQDVIRVRRRSRSEESIVPDSEPEQSRGSNDSSDGFYSEARQQYDSAESMDAFQVSMAFPSNGSSKSGKKRKRSATENARVSSSQGSANGFAQEPIVRQKQDKQRRPIKRQRIEDPESEVLEGNK